MRRFALLGQVVSMWRPRRRGACTPSPKVVCVIAVLGRWTAKRSVLKVKKKTNDDLITHCNGFFVCRLKKYTRSFVCALFRRFFSRTLVGTAVK